MIFLVVNISIDVFLVGKVQKFKLIFFCPFVQQIEPDEEHFTSDSEDDSVTTRRSKSHDRRKHQRMWTLTEVMNLVDGISEYGVGRWTDIKRLLFAASAYRTPIDLRVHGNSLPNKVVSLFSNIESCSLPMSASG